MCGICGIYNYRSNKPVDSDVLRAMNVTLARRGPDDEGYFVENEIGLAMRRLSIIDIEGGQQPVHNEDKTVWIVFNGEIFNYPELRSALERKGHNFYTSSDTETIVHLYEDHGEKCIKFLRGMFAFAIWDCRNRSLLVARDRIGIKPLFYSQIRNEEILFSSEPKAILANPGFSREMDLQALDAYFAYGYIPAPLSIYSNIRKLPAGHFMIINRSGVTIQKYWDLYFRPDYGKPPSYFAEKFEEIFSDAVKMRLMSEVPLGAFLSGGLDSGLVTAFMSKNMVQKTRTFSVGFSGDTGGYLDERPYARMVADKFDCRHAELVVTPQVDGILTDIAGAFDEPFADDSVIPTYYICQAAKRDVTVALTGLGGDELFAGYERYLGFRLSLMYEHIPRFLSKKVILPLVNRLPEYKNGHYTVNHMKRFIRAAHMPGPERYTGYLTILGPADRASLYHPDIRHRIDFNATEELMLTHYNADNAREPMDKMFYVDIKTYLPEDILALTDRIGMHHSMELRVPFTDHVLMEMCATIPAGMKLRNFRKKSMLKDIAIDKLPYPVLTHRKQGFASPIAQWLKSDLKGLSRVLLSNESLGDGIINPGVIQKMYAEHVTRKELKDRAIFALIMFRNWQEVNRRASREAAA